MNWLTRWFRRQQTTPEQAKRLREQQHTATVAEALVEHHRKIVDDRITQIREILEKERQLITRNYDH